MRHVLLFLNQMSEDKILQAFDNVDALGYGSNPIVCACRDGYVKVIEYLYEKQRKEYLINKYSSETDIRYLQRKIVLNAIEYGHTHILDWAHEKDFEWPNNAIVNSIKHNQHHILKWFLSTSKNIFKNSQYNPCITAVAHHRFNILKWMYEHNLHQWHQEITREAAKRGHLDILKWLHEKECPMPQDLCNIAATNNFLNILQWARKIGCHWDESTVYMAGYNQNLKIFKWCVQHRCPLSFNAINVFLGTFHDNVLSVLDLLYQNNCPMNIKTFNIAIEHQPLNVLQWLHSHQCSWDGESLITATIALGMDDYFEKVKWLWDNGCPRPANLLEIALSQNNIKVAQLCYDNGFTLPSRICKQLNYSNRYLALWWAICHGAEWDMSDVHDFKIRVNASHPIHNYVALRDLQNKYNVFPKVVTTWLGTIDNSLSQIFYEDLTNLIKTYL